MGAGAVVVLGPGHGYGSPGMGQGIVKPVGAELSGNSLLRASGAVPVWISSLDHKSVDNPVEGQSVIESAFRQGNKILHGLRRRVPVQLHRNGAVVFHRDFRRVIPRRRFFFLLLIVPDQHRRHSRDHNQYRRGQNPLLSADFRPSGLLRFSSRF